MTYAKQYNGVWIESVSLPQQYTFADGSRTVLRIAAEIARIGAIASDAAKRWFPN